MLCLYLLFCLVLVQFFLFYLYICQNTCPCVFYCFFIQNITNLIHNQVYVTSELQEVCDGQEFIAECQGDMALLVQSAVLGRMRLGKCVLNDFGYIGCKNDVLRLADKWCSGLSRCNFLISNEELKEANKACAADLNLYLEIVYSCVPGK